MKKLIIHLKISHKLILAPLVFFCVLSSVWGQSQKGDLKIDVRFSGLYQLGDAAKQEDNYSDFLGMEIIVKDKNTGEIIDTVSFNYTYYNLSFELHTYYLLVKKVGINIFDF